MKKSIIAILLCSVLLVCGCQSASTPSEPDSQPSKNDPTPTVTTEQPTPETQPPASSDYPEEIAYLNLPLVPANGFSSHLFGKTDETRFLKLSLPSKWKLSKRSAEEFSIEREGKQIGTVISREADDLTSWTPVAAKKDSVLGVEVEAYIEKSGTGDTLAFRQRFHYHYRTSTQKDLTLIVDYQEVDTEAKNKLMTDISFHSIGANPKFGILSDAEKDNILILGNSFVGTSSIGSILREMLQKNGKGCNVTSISRGMATVATYTADSYMMDMIRSGDYDIVFICGFYSASEINHLRTLKTACDTSNTKLVIFPAHNEDSNVVTTATATFSDIALINWKQEIELLITNGVNIWDFCIDDYYLHSTSLAGYVGAHAIYRAMYGTVPTQPLSSSISQSYVDEKLGEYTRTGLISIFPAESLHFF